MDINISDMNTMGSPNTRNTGNRGEEEVRHFFSRNGMSVIDYPQSQDVGTDLIVDVQLEDSNTGNTLDLGYPVRVQVKTGTSYFSSPGCSLDNNGKEVDGWWFSCDGRHHNYWTRHFDSFLLILVKLNDESDYHEAPEMYWQWLDEEGRYCPTRKPITPDGLQNESSQNDMHYKIFIPSSQIVDEGLCDILKEAAYNHWLSTRVASADIYNFNIEEVPASQQARYAMLLPDLTAPHVNKGYDHAISWPEALALCVLHHPSRWSNDYYSFADQFEEVPNIKEAKSSSDAGWQFAGWYYDYHFLNGNENPDGFEELSGLPAELQAARAVIVSARAYHEKQFHLAIQVIDAAIDGIKAKGIDDIDMAWLLIQKGNSLCELAKIDEATSAYAKSQRLTRASKTNETDLTAKLLHSVATVAIYYLQTPPRRDVGGLISANDNELARFSLRREAANFDKLIDERFDAWSPSGDITFGASGTLLINCQVSLDVSLLSGNVPSYRQSLSQMAMIELSERGAEGDAAVGYLSALLRAGDANRLGQALEKIKRTYDPKIVTDFIERLSPADVTPVTSAAYFKAIVICGEFLSKSRSDEWFAFLIAALEDPIIFAKRYTPPGVYRFWPTEAIKCMCSMRYQLSSNVMNRIVNSIISSKVSLEPASSEIRGLLLALNDDPARTRERITTAGEPIPQWLEPILSEAFTGVTQEKREAIHREILSGNLSHIEQIGSFDSIEPDEIVAIINKGLAILKEICVQANDGVYTGRSIDYGYLTTYLVTHYPEYSNCDIDRWWDRIIELLEKPLINNREKVSAAKVIISNIMRVPVEQARKIDARGSMILKSVDWGLLPSDGGDERIVLQAMLIAAYGRVRGFDEAIRMAACDLEGINRYNVSLLEYTANPGLSLLAACSSDDYEIRYKAFETLVSVCCEDERRFKEYSDFFSKRCLSGCSDYARGLINALYCHQNHDSEAKKLLDKLANSHPSAIVRHHANNLLSR
ncbi:DUF4365 domain-containing protein [Tractidigestivibacter scatoligenes]|nr:DUF4365 domain-containing protein [Tractidigestivibacter scatoligenes]